MRVAPPIASLSWSYGIAGSTVESRQSTQDALDWLEQRVLQYAGRPNGFSMHVSKQQYAEDRRRLDPGWRDA